VLTVIARDASQSTGGSWKVIPYSTSTQKNTGSDVPAGNRVHVDITVFAQNDMYNNILNCGTPYAEFPVYGE
jgi:hypothetical protein